MLEFSFALVVAVLVVAVISLWSIKRLKEAHIPPRGSLAKDVNELRDLAKKFASLNLDHAAIPYTSTAVVDGLGTITADEWGCSTLDGKEVHYHELDDDARATLLTVLRKLAEPYFTARLDEKVKQQTELDALQARLRAFASSHEV
jgi:hypothetical protein